MLVLTRKIGQSIVTNNGVRITIVDLGPNGRVRVGIEAPAHVGILREEILPPEDLAIRGTIWEQG